MPHHDPLGSRSWGHSGAAIALGAVVAALLAARQRPRGDPPGLPRPPRPKRPRGPRGGYPLPQPVRPNGPHTLSGGAAAELTFGD